MTYSDLKRELENCPKIWVPALLDILVRSALKRGGIFKPGGVGRIVSRIEDEVESEQEKSRTDEKA